MARQTLVDETGDGDTHFDYCMVFRAENERLSAVGEGIVKSMLKSGFILKNYLSYQRDEILVLITCPSDKLAAFADLVDYKMYLDDAAVKEHAERGDALRKVPPVSIPHNPEITPRLPYEFIYGKYDTDPALQDLYWRPPNMTHPFRESVRLKLINLMLQAPPSEGGCGLALRKLVVKKHMLAFYPLHNQGLIRQLEDKWLSWKVLPWNQPLWDIKEYFGEKIGLYFAFLGHYTTYCLIPAIVGLAIQLHVAVTGNTSAPSVPFFSLFVSFWAIFMLEFWKRKEKTTALEWGTTGFEAEQKDRPEYHGDEIESIVTGKPITYFPPTKRANLIFQSTLVIITLIAIVVGIVAGIYALRILLAKTDKTMASSVASILNAIQIQVMNIVYGNIADALTDRENHRTDTQYEDSLIAKMFMFQFVNSYASLFYVAFIQETIEGTEQPTMDQLALNLSIIFFTRLVSGNLIELYMPKYKAQMRVKQETGGTDESVLTRPEQEYILAPYDIIKGVIKDYAELAIQFGYLTLFVVAFPAAPFLAFISNVVEVKVDAHKVLHFQQRPIPTGAEDIGTWQVIFTLIAGAAVISNGALTCFIMDTFNGHSDYSRAWFFLGFQYLVCSIMYILSLLVPDEPEDVAIQLQRREFVVPKIIDRVADEDDTDLLEQLGTMRETMHIEISIDDKL